MNIGRDWTATSLEPQDTAALPLLPEGDMENLISDSVFSHLLKGKDALDGFLISFINVDRKYISS